VRLCDYAGQILVERATTDDRIWVIDADLADSDGAHFFASAFPSRFVMAGIAEQCAVSVGAGLAACGRLPFVFSFAAFLCSRAYDQIRTSISQTRLPVVLIGSHAGGCSGRNGKSHTILNDIALLSSLPSIEVWAPADFSDLTLCLNSIVKNPRPVYIRLPRDPMPVLPGTALPVRMLRKGGPIFILSSGAMTPTALEVATLLSRESIDASVVHCPLLRPFPVDVITSLLARSQSIFVIEDHYEFGGLAAALRQYTAFPVTRWFGWPSAWSGKSGSAREVLAAHGLAAIDIAENMCAHLR
jgi:transketolase